MKSGTGIVAAVFALCLSSLVEAREMRAYYTQMHSGQEFERYSRTGPYADIVIELKDGKFIFWRGSSYLPCWETSQGKWFVDELFERKGDGPIEQNRADLQIDGRRDRGHGPHAADHFSVSGPRIRTCRIASCPAVKTGVGSVRIIPI